MKGSGTEFFDPAHLKTEEYADSRKFRARTSIYRYQHPDVDFREWALSFLPSDLGMVLDVGCGPGDYLSRVSRTERAQALVGVDLSAGLLGEIRDVDATLCVADAQALPLESESFAATLCMHMLYHVPDIDLAIGELRRVTKLGGTVLIATNGSEHQRGIRDAFDASVADLSAGKAGPVLSTERRFRLEDGSDMLRSRFASVERHDLSRELVVPEVGPVVTYLESVRSFHEAKLPKDVSWEDAVGRFSQRVQDEIDRTGSFRSSVYAGVFVCR